MNPADHYNGIFPRGEKVAAEHFTGTAWVNILVPRDETGSYAVGNVEFEPRCRNNWHKHPAGQILLITHGSGYYQERGRPARVLAKGDVVVIPSGVEHWHGAAHDSRMIHVVVTNNSKDCAVEWLSPVTDEEYDRLRPAQPGSAKSH